jgi:hypothetical protein
MTAAVLQLWHTIAGSLVEVTEEACTPDRRTDRHRPDRQWSVRDPVSPDAPVSEQP